VIDLIKGFITYGFLAVMCGYFGWQSYNTEPRSGWQWFGAIFFAVLTILWLWMSVRGLFA